MLGGELGLGAVTHPQVLASLDGRRLDQRCSEARRVRESFGHSAHFKIKTFSLLKKGYLFLRAHNKQASEGWKSPSAWLPCSAVEAPRVFFSRAIVALHLCEVFEANPIHSLQRNHHPPRQKKTVFPWQQPLAQVQACHPRQASQKHPWDPKQRRAAL